MTTPAAPQPVQPVSAPRRVLKLLVRRAWILSLPLTLAVLLAMFWSDPLTPVPPASRPMLALHYAAFMAQTFQLHIAIALGCCAIVALLAKSRKLLVLSLVPALVAAAPIVIPRTQRAPDTGKSLTVMSVNLMYGRMNADTLLAQIAREDPDVLVFQEWTPGAHELLRARLVKDWPHTHAVPQTDAFGQAVFSKSPFTRPVREFPPIGAFTEPQISCAVELDGKEVRICNVHVLPPVSGAYFREQRQQAAWLGEWAGEVEDKSRASRPHLFIGDFNATTRSSIVGIIRSAGYSDAHAVGSSAWGQLRSTWPRAGILKFFPGIRIDQALFSDELRCVRCRVGEDFGSDHRPVIVRLCWANAGTPAP